MDLPQVLIDIEPETYFMEMLPAQFDKMKQAFPPEMSSIKLAVTFQMFGARNGTWTLQLDAGTLTGIKGESPDRIAKIVMRTEDWIGSLNSERGLKFDPVGKNTFNDIDKNVFFSEARIERLKSIKGSIRIRLIEPGSPDWEIAAIFGLNTPRELDCVITMSFGDAKAIRNGNFTAQDAFMSGKIHISGDIGFAFTLASALAS